MQDDQVKPQDGTMRNSPKAVDEGAETADPGAMAAASGDNFCYWNDKKYSDGGTVCDSGQRFKCWNGRWVDIGNC